MPTLYTRQTDFTGGEWSPKLVGRVDLERYHRSLRRCENYIVLQGGGAERRAGTKFVAQAAAFCRLVRWEYNPTDSYALEFSAGKIRFYRNSVRVENPPGTPVEVVTTYTLDELRSLKFTQSADTFFIAHQAHPLAVLQRLSTTSWRLRDFAFDVPPSYEYGDRPTVTLTPASTGPGAGINLTAGAAYWVNADVGRTVEVISGANLGAKATITGFTSSTVVVATITEAFANTSANAAGTWKIGSSPRASVTPSAKDPVGLAMTLTADIAAWRTTDVGKFAIVNGGTFEIQGFTSATVVQARIRGEADAVTAAPADSWTLEEAAFSSLNGYPAAVSFFNDRLGLNSTPAQPLTSWLSKTGDYGNFATGVLDDDAVVFTLNDEQATNIVWAVGRKRWLLGGAGSEFVLAPAEGQTLTPSNIPVNPETSHGSSGQLAPIPVGNVVLFGTRSRRKLRELVFSFEVDTYVAPDLLLLAEHMTRPVRINGARVNRRLVDLAYQRDPTPIIWAVREDGTLLGCTYLRDQNVVAWHRHITGGNPGTDPAGFAIPATGDGQVESVAVIQHPDGDREQVWLSVRRLINGATVRYVEVLDDAGLAYDQLNTDSTLTYDGTQTIGLNPNGLSGAGVAFTTTGLAALFAAGDVGKEIRNLVGDGRATIVTYLSPSQVLADITIPWTSSAEMTSGTWGLAVFSVSGLSHLEGQTVAIVGDGAEYAPQVVAAGAVTLNPAYAAVKLEVGLPYISTLVTQRPEAEQLGTLQGKQQRNAEVSVLFHESLGAQINGNRVDFREPEDLMGEAPPLFSGFVKVPDLDASEDGTEALITVEQRSPLPQTVLLVVGHLNAEDG